MSREDLALEPFHPVVREWFHSRFPAGPTDVQRRAWPEIAAGRHCLITAPTGAGKTLTAFLWALDRLLTGATPGGAVRVLYVSPLKALNTDVRRNLEEPLAELTARFTAAGTPPPRVGVATRSGDTPAEERQRMARRPPEILITTPESLNLLLTSARGRAMLGTVETVILDEVHAVAGSKRGTHLATAVERLTRLAGEVQRIALSATVRPLERVAEWVGGYYRLASAPDGPRYERREVALVRTTERKAYQLEVRAVLTVLTDVPADGDEENPDLLWDELALQLRRLIAANRSTLVFANSRRTTEKLTRFLNADRTLAYAHHGSLSREVRQVVEERMKRGELPAIVATSSLELGIDIGALDEVVLVQTPRSVAGAVQRVGRAGHRVGEVSRGTLFPLFGRDYLEAAVMARAVLDGEVEAIAPVEGPLDVLAQVILSMVAAEEWHLDELYDHLRCSAPYHHLPRRHFELVVEMLAGRYADTRLRELKPRVSLDRVAGTVRGRPGAERLIYLSGGTIPDRGYFNVRVAGSNARLGELDEEFVWERSVGDTFAFGTQIWRVQKITHNDVLVEPARGSAAMPPFWRSEAEDRGFFLSAKVGTFLGQAEGALGTREQPELLARWQDEHALSAPAAQVLAEYLSGQKAALGGVLPHRYRVVLERVEAAGERQRRPDGPDRGRLVVHTFWGGRVNRPLAVALSAAWSTVFGGPVEVIHDDDALMICAAASELEALRAHPGGLFGLLAPEKLEDLLRARLEGTGFFGALFRQNAGRALLLPRFGFKTRTPLWLNRQRAKNLLDAVRRYGDFPLVLETWRDCLRDELDLVTTRQLLTEALEGTIEVRWVRTQEPSPFAANLLWRETNRLMYEDDEPPGGSRGSLAGDLLKELVHASHLRPRLAPALSEEFRRKVQRLAPGYAPRDAEDLRDWLVERLLIPVAEWAELLAAMAGAREDLEAALAERAVTVLPPGAVERSVVALDNLPRALRVLGGPDGLARPLEALSVGPLGSSASGLPAAILSGLTTLLTQGSAETADDGDRPAEWFAELLAEWLRFYGPLAPSRVAEVFGASPELSASLDGLLEEGRVVLDELTAGAAGAELCDAGNLEILLRWTRVAARPAFQALPLERLPLFLAAHQGLAPRGEDLDDLQSRLEALLGFSAPAAAWEEELLPARFGIYRPSFLDTLLRETELAWVGAGAERLAFSFPAELAVIRADDRTLVPGAAELFPNLRGRYSLADLAAASGRPASRLTEDLWQLAWAGEVSNDSFEAVRRGVLNRFRPEGVEAGAVRGFGRRPAFDRWTTGRVAGGRWYRLPDGAWEQGEGGEPPAPRDALELDELYRERARWVLARYGVVFRELLAREEPVFQGARIFRALRLLELAGEVLAGQFFVGVPGLQFASPAAFKRLRDGQLPDDAVFWCNASDPASLAGVDLPELKAALPERRPGNHVVYHGCQLVVVSRRKGKALQIAVPPEHPRLGEYLGFLKDQLCRDFHPEKSITVEEINGVLAARSPYRPVFQRVFSATSDGRSLDLRRRYDPPEVVVSSEPS